MPCIHFSIFCLAWRKVALCTKTGCKQEKDLLWLWLVHCSDFFADLFTYLHDIYFILLELFYYWIECLPFYYHHINSNMARNRGKAKRQANLSTSVLASHEQIYVQIHSYICSLCIHQDTYLCTHFTSIVSIKKWMILNLKPYTTLSFFY